MTALGRRTLLGRSLAGLAVAAARVPLIVAPSAFVPACAAARVARFAGVDASTGRNVVLVSGALPAGVVDFGGEYRSPQLGDVSLVQRGDRVVGRYVVSREGLKLEGTLVGCAQGNLARLRFVEQTHDGLSRAQGRGYFLLDRPRSDARIRLFGERTCEVRISASYPRTASRTRSESAPWSAARVDRRG